MARKQLRLPKTGTKANDELDAAAEHYVDIRDQRMGLTESEVEAHDTLVEVMKKHDQTLYVDVSAGLRVTIKKGEQQKDRAKVERLSEAEVAALKQGAKEGEPNGQPSGDSGGEVTPSAADAH